MDEHESGRIISAEKEKEVHLVNMTCFGILNRLFSRAINTQYIKRSSLLDLTFRPNIRDAGGTGGGTKVVIEALPG